MNSRRVDVRSTFIVECVVENKYCTTYLRMGMSKNISKIEVTFSSHLTPLVSTHVRVAIVLRPHSSQTYMHHESTERTKTLLRHDTRRQTSKILAFSY